MTSSWGDPASRLPNLLPLGVLAGISPLATDMYIPGLPLLAEDLRTSSGVAQLSLTAFLVAFAVGQFVIGPISDAVGRRSILVAGTAVFVVSSAACALAPSAAVLITARLLQGVAGACGSIAARAMVTDVLSGVRRAQTIGTLSALNAVGPVAAPLIGGALLLVGSWRASFWVLTAIGIALLISVLVSFDETLPAESRGKGVGMGATAGRVVTLLRIPRFTLYLATSCVATVGFFSYIATSSFVFQEVYGFTETQYTVVFAVNAACMIATTIVFRRLVGRIAEDVFLSVGLVVGTLASVALVVGALADVPAGVVWACLAVVTGAWGFVITGSATRTRRWATPCPAPLRPCKGDWRSDWADSAPRWRERSGAPRWRWAR